MTDPSANTVVVKETASGRPAVLARYRRGMPWRQVDSCPTLVEAEAVAARLELNSRVRCDTIDEWVHEDWGDDAPLTIQPE